MISYSLLDLSPILEGSDAAVAFRNTLDLAQHAENWGYHRYWLAEHHNLPSIASAATSVVIGYVAGGTKTIRVGAGGIMLPNHAPLVVAEQFGTLESLYPGRIDLALGRAPGTDQATARALRRYFESADSFPEDLLELMSYFRRAETWPARNCHSRCRIACSHFSSGLERFQRATRGGTRFAVRFRIAFRTGLFAYGARNLSARIQALSRFGKTVCDCRRRPLCGRQR